VATVTAMTKRTQDRFKQLCAEVAEQQGCDPSHEVCQHIATLRLARENLTARLIEGAAINPIIFCAWTKRCARICRRQNRKRSRSKSLKVFMAATSASIAPKKI
jgi:hypothetical protein